MAKLDREQMVRAAARAAYEACLAVDNETHGERGPQWRELHPMLQREQVSMAEAILAGAPAKRFPTVFRFVTISTWAVLSQECA